MNIDRPTGRDEEQRRRQDQAVGDDHEQLGVQRCEQRDRPSVDSLGLVHRQPQFECRLLHRARARMPTAAGGSAWLR